MGKTIRLAWALIRIRHLAISLFLIPLVLSVVFVVGQLIITQLLLSELDPLSAPATKSVEEQPHASTTEGGFRRAIRMVVYGSGDKRAPLRVCRWKVAAGVVGGEAPPSQECNPDRLDVALQVEDPATFSVDTYARLFNGQVDRLHVCRSCSPDVVIRIGRDGEKETRTFSVYGLAVLALAFEPVEELQGQRMERMSEILGTMGDISFLVPESSRAIELSASNGAIPITANLVPLVVIALWLAVRAHRKVLDYFARNDVLLPLVAATGKGPFYGAVWLLTALRVMSFLVASTPVIYFGLKDIGGREVFNAVSGDVPALVVWILALVAAVALSTIVSSVADLKHRQGFLTLFYRYVPVIVAFIGSFIWVVTFLVPTSGAGIARLWITALPVVGMGPIFISLVSGTTVAVVGLHAILSVGLVVWLLRGNARWFAAHLEEV